MSFAEDEGYDGMDVEVYDYKRKQRMSTKTVTGIVDKISEKEWFDNRKDEEVTLYSFTIEGERGWFRTGTTRPPVTRGSAVRFVVDTRKGNVDLDSIEEVEETEVTRAPKAAGNYTRNSSKFPKKTSGASGGGTRDDYWKEKDRYYKEVEVPRITLSACQSRAIDVVKMALENDALNLGTTKNKRMDNLLAAVDEVTERFIEQINNIGNAPAEKKKKAEGEPFDDEIPFGDESNNDGWDD